LDVIPAVDVLDGRVVRLRQGRYDDVTVYADDPAEMVGSWVEQGAPLVHVVDLAGARDGMGDRTLWKRLGDSGLPFQLGGGIRTREDVAGLLAAGATRAVLGTTAVWDAEVTADIVAGFGAEAVVAAVDVRAGRATGAGWRDEGRDLTAVLGDLVAAGAVRALVTGIAGDGMLTGPDTGLLQQVQKVAPELALIASGGIGSLEDIAAVAGLGVEAAIVGRALYDGRFSLAEALQAAAAAR
jgi:phosphoribosylformimino-5-aminoimidazole carboxamide ribotide isomerase